MKKHCYLLLLMLLPAVLQGQTREPMPMPESSVDSVMKHVIELSSEVYQGRLAGSEGNRAALEYVERVLARYGVKPVERVWEQQFETECNEVENCKFNTYIPGTKEKRVYTLGNEFCCAGMTGRGYVDAQLVFCGYGIDHGSMNEYEYVDAKGKIVVVLTGVPEGIPSSVASHYTTLRDKARVAERHGAIGLLAINTSQSCLPYEPQGRVYCGELPHLTAFPILHLTMDCGRELLRGEEMSLDTAMAVLALRETASFALLKKGEIDVNAYYRPHAVTANAVGRLEGTDKRLKDEIIVVGASIDGVGIQGETCLFPGADINASGVATMIEVARLLSDPEFRPKRSVVFVVFNASEQQYLGSRVFVSNFNPLHKIEAFINIQNTGSGDSLVVLGDNRYPSLWEVAHYRDTLTGRRQLLTTAERSNPRGDAVAFDAIGIPSLVFTTHQGLQHNRVASDIWENIDRRILGQAAQLTVETVAELGEGLYQGRSPKSKAYRF